MSEARTALRNQALALKAVLLREAMVTFSWGFGIAFLASMLEPVFHIGVVVLWHWLMRIIPVYGTSKVLFISSGLYPLFVFIHLSTMFGAAKTDQSGRRFPRVQLLDVILVKALIKLLVYFGVGILLFGGIYLFVTPQGLPFAPAKALQAMAILAVMGIGAGMCNAAIDPIFPLWHMIYTPVARAMILFGGVLYVPDLLPTFTRDFVIWNPASHGVQLFRQAFYPGYPQVVYMPNFLLVSAYTSLVLGLCLLRVMRGRIEAKA
jgi:capsular polysaccharide transport system permease protein